MIRFKLDENVHPDAALLLRRRGHDVQTVWEEGLHVRPDPEIGDACVREGRALITLDRGYADIRTYPPELRPGTVVLRLRSQSRAAVLSTIGRVIGQIERQQPTGKLFVVTERAVRIRGAAPAGE